MIIISPSLFTPAFIFITLFLPLSTFGLFLLFPLLR